MFGIGFLEIGVILLVAVVVFGPDKLPEFARQAAMLVRKGREFANTARDELRTELGPEYADLELRDLDPRVIVRKHITEALEAVDADDASTPAKRAGQRPLLVGELPPYDADAT